MDTREKRGETPGPERRRAYVELLWTVMVRKHLRIRRREKTRRYLHGAKGVMPSSSAGLIGCVKAKFRLWSPRTRFRHLCVMQRYQSDGDKNTHEYEDERAGDLGLCFWVRSVQSM